MKKAQAKKFMLLAILLIVFGLIVLVSFLGGSGLLFGAFKQVPELLNDTFSSMQGRPTSNTAYLINSIQSSYIYANQNTIPNVCFYEVSEFNSRLLKGYVSVEQKGDDVEIKFNLDPVELDDDEETEEEDNYLPVNIEGKLCVVKDNLASVIVSELNSRGWGSTAWDDISTFFGSGFGIGDYEHNPFIINSPLTLVSEVRLRTDRSGIENIKINEESYKVSSYMLYYNNNICFIPYTTYGGDCSVRNGLMNEACMNRIRKRFKCG